MSANIEDVRKLITIASMYYYSDLPIEAIAWQLHTDEKEVRRVVDELTKAGGQGGEREGDSLTGTRFIPSHLKRCGFSLVPIPSVVIKISNGTIFDYL
ncbi:hypothetical protein [Candidatus Nitrososphaera gargensis]|uniref:hypothetical protein n=1 Tax=Candidatus Nitrososphaera gargensis TaxID=497727 RepID=UPI0011E50083|nr:hypothetical protein [Candidatus Nitrososphaera gargensis]